MPGRRPLRAVPASFATAMLAVIGLGSGCQQVRDEAIDGKSHRLEQVPAPAGVPVPGTRVVVPRSASTGRPIRIVAPAGSVVTFGGADFGVPSSGVLLLDAPATRGEARLTVERPDGRKLVFRIRIQ